MHADHSRVRYTFTYTHTHNISDMHGRYEHSKNRNVDTVNECRQRDRGKRLYEIDEHKICYNCTPLTCCYRCRMHEINSLCSSTFDTSHSNWNELDFRWNTRTVMLICVNRARITSLLGSFFFLLDMPACLTLLY